MSDLATKQDIERLEAKIDLIIANLFPEPVFVGDMVRMIVRVRAEQRERQEVSRGD